MFSIITSVKTVKKNSRLNGKVTFSREKWLFEIFVLVILLVKTWKVSFTLEHCYFSVRILTSGITQRKKNLSRTLSYNNNF